MFSLEKFKVRPIDLKTANRFVVENHRHHKQVKGHKFSIGAYLLDSLIGVAICGRPVSRHLDTGLILEVTRLCTDGTKNACSFLYSTSARIAREMGYEKIITYILQSEHGISLIASGWKCEEKSCGGTKWTRNDGYRFNETSTLFGIDKKYPSELKQRWSKQL